MQILTELPSIGLFERGFELIDRKRPVELCAGKRGCGAGGNPVDEPGIGGDDDPRPTR
jgi:hypothetical protein